MSDWVMFLRSQTAKDAYKTFKQELEDERAYIRRKNLFEKVKQFKEEEKAKVDEGMKRRQDALEKYDSFLKEMIQGSKKNMKYREEIVKKLRQGASKVMDISQQRDLLGMWNHGVLNDTDFGKTFNTEEKNTLYKLMREYGLEMNDEAQFDNTIRVSTIPPKDVKYILNEYGGYTLTPDVVPFKPVTISKDYPLRIRKLYADEPDTTKRLTEDELQDNLYRRQDAILNHFRLIDSLDEYGTTGKRYRKWLKNRIITFATDPFKTEEEEYKAIGKYGKGMFNEVEMEKSLDKDQLKEMRQFAEEYGAFDY